MSEGSPAKNSLLVIDDDVSMLEMVQSLLGPHLARLWSSADPHEGLRLAMIHKPALVLLDQNMPGLNGLEILLQLRTMPGTQQLPVVMMTADNRAETVQTAAEHQVQGYLLKPFDMKTLVEKIRPWVDLSG